MVGIGPMEIAFVIGIAVLLLGPDKIPSLGRS
ncbi:MAG: Sec-independent protein translocase subunit TatA/TatB, partial [Candidatus Hodarchaeales archaeon]